MALTPTQIFGAFSNVNNLLSNFFAVDVVGIYNQDNFEQIFKESYNKEIRYFSFDDEIKLFYLIMWQFPRADFIADWCLEETLD